MSLIAMFSFPELCQWADDYSDSQDVSIMCDEIAISIVKTRGCDTEVL
jgi:hypothetical protein